MCFLPLNKKKSPISRTGRQSVCLRSVCNSLRVCVCVCMFVECNRQHLDYLLKTKDIAIMYVTQIRRCLCWTRKKRLFTTNTRVACEIAGLSAYRYVLSPSMCLCVCIHSVAPFNNCCRLLFGKRDTTIIRILNAMGLSAKISWIKFTTPQIEQNIRKTNLHGVGRCHRCCCCRHSHRYRHRGIKQTFWTNRFSCHNILRTRMLVDVVLAENTHWTPTLSRIAFSTVVYRKGFHQIAARISIIFYLHRFRFSFTTNIWRTNFRHTHSYIRMFVWSLFRFFSQSENRNYTVVFFAFNIKMILCVCWRYKHNYLFIFIIRQFFSARGPDKNSFQRERKPHLLISNVLLYSRVFYICSIFVYFSLTKLYVYIFPFCISSAETTLCVRSGVNAIWKWEKISHTNKHSVASKEECFQWVR